MTLRKLYGFPGSRPQWRPPASLSGAELILVCHIKLANNRYVHLCFPRQRATVALPPCKAGGTGLNFFCRVNPLLTPGLLFVLPPDSGPQWRCLHARLAEQDSTPFVVSTLS